MTETKPAKKVISWLISQGVVSSQKELGEIVGVTNKSYLSQLVSNPTSEFANKLCNLSSALNRDYILTGEGEMLKQNIFRNEIEDISAEDAAMISKGLEDGTFKMVPLINIDSVGGIHSENTISASEQYTLRMLPFTEARTGDVAILQSGISMSPIIPPGSVLLIREVVDWKEYFGYGGLFVLLLKDGRRITKEIRRYDEDARNYVWCVSYNPEIADEELPKSMIREVWKVIKFQADFGW